ncbi:MAG: DUF86 domain-containing protein [Acetobacteraceae bacterium]|nr:DUF86 domain-containing protein [Acetobacteraceae bacterium]
MNDRSPKLLWDARRAAMRAMEFLGDRDLADYLASNLVQSAVERQIEIMGEALTSLRRTDPDLASQVPDLPRIIGTRNILIHRYASVDNEKVWLIVTQELPGFIAAVTALLESLPGAD